MDPKEKEMGKSRESIGESAPGEKKMHIAGRNDQSNQKS